MNNKIKLLFLITNILFSNNLSMAQSNPVLMYKVKIEPSFSTKSITGSVQIVFTKLESKIIEIPIHDLIINSVKIKKKLVTYSNINNTLKIDLTKEKINLNSPLNVEIMYHGEAKEGLVWGANYVYTNFEPCTWMICFDDPGLRVPLDLEIKIPNGLQSVANGELIKTLKPDKNLRTESWSEKRPYSSYLYGFSIGRFEQVIQKYGDVQLEYLSVLETSTEKLDELKNKFKDTEKIIQFFEEKSGVPIPLKRYTQVLVPDSEAQEKNGFSVLGKKFVDPILVDPKEDWAIVHELAHQWWGNLLTCKSWDHFWLNEGIVVFMTAAYKQNHWGQEAYDREMELAKKRYQKAIDEKFDVPLTYSGHYPSLGIKRSIVYSKGALFLNALRKELGEVQFWNGLKKYTTENQFKSVVTKDFQIAMEKSSGKDLSIIFNQWVY